MSRILFVAKSQSKGNAHEQTIICRQVFVGHVRGSANEKKEKKVSNDNVFYYMEDPSVISLIDVTIRAFSTLWNELGFLCRLLLASIDKPV